MDVREMYLKLAKWVSPKVLTGIIKIARVIPAVRRMVEEQYAEIAHEMERMLKPYREKYPVVTEIPETGRDKDDILAEMEEIKATEEPRWKDGYASGAVYHGGAEHIEFLNNVYAINSQSNPLHSDLWPSSAKYEAEIISMTGKMLGAGEAGLSSGVEIDVCGVVTTGGTESIMLAMKAYRDWARKEKKITRPEMVVPSTIHAAFDKAAHCFGIKMRRVPVGRDLRADVEATREAITRNTVVLAGSAPCFPYGTIDPIEELSELARKREIGFHTDACLGGFVLPWAEKLGYEIPPFDFRLPGVTSISVDTHKYGYAPKGTSVILYRSPELRHYQYFKFTEWPGGIYFTPTFPGSRPGALSAACWAALVSVGKNGYMEATRKILETASVIKGGVSRISGLHIMGNPLWNIAFNSDTGSIYEVLEIMTEKNWSLNGLQNPPCVHICVTLRHTQPGVAERFLSDLEDAVGHVGSKPINGEQKVAIYGMATTFPDRSLVREALDMYLDIIYKA